MTDNLKHKIIKYLNSEYPELERFETEKNPYYIFFMKDDKFIFYYNKKNGYVGISYDKIWSFWNPFLV
jgi:glutaredoxin-related protein